MTEKTEFTPEEALAELLAEVRKCRHKLGAIAGWVAFMGLVLLLSIGLSMCSAVMGMG